MLNKETVHLMTISYGGGVMQVIAELQNLRAEPEDDGKTPTYFPGGYLKLVRPYQIYAQQAQDGKVSVGLVPVDPFMDEKADLWVRVDQMNTITTPSAQMYKAYSEARTGLMLPTSGVSETPAGLHLVQ